MNAHNVKIITANGVVTLRGPVKNSAEKANIAAKAHEVRVAHEGLAALETARTWHPDVALLDSGLQGIDGHEVARQIRELPGLRRLLLIAVTGYGQPEDRQRSMESGFDHHLVKPIDLDNLRKLLATLP